MHEGQALQVKASVLQLRFSGLEPFVWVKAVHIRASSLTKFTVVMAGD